MFVVSCSLLVVRWFVGSAAKVKGAQTPRKSACKEPRIQAVLTVKIGGSLHKAGRGEYLEAWQFVARRVLKGGAGVNLPKRVTL